MRQSNELPKLLVGFVKEAEERGAAREREMYTKARSNQEKRFLKLSAQVRALADKLSNMARVSALTASHRRAVGVPLDQIQPKKRKPVEASAECIAGVREVFEKYPNSIVLPKNLNIGFGLKNASAACRSLVESGVLEKAGSKGYRLAQRKENGLDETQA